MIYEIYYSKNFFQDHKMDFPFQISSAYISLWGNIKLFS